MPSRAERRRGFHLQKVALSVVISVLAEAALAAPSQDAAAPAIGTAAAREPAIDVPETSGSPTSPEATEPAIDAPTTSGSPTSPEATEPAIDAPELALGAPVQHTRPPKAAVTPQGSAAPCEGAACDQTDGDQADEAADQQSALYLALLGPALGAGLGFDYSPIPALAVGVGLGGVPPFEREGTGWIPWASVSSLRGDDHKVELGVGLTMWINNQVVWALPGPLVAYRYQPRDGGFFFRASLHGLVRLEAEPDFFLWPGLAFGGTWLN